ncbi:hypothetical protein NL676_005330 [Syzygium grande]|nr:hypothetical protein NL676_005330 [Syzygium grande]
MDYSSIQIKGHASKYVKAGREQARNKEAPYQNRAQDEMARSACIDSDAIQTTKISSPDNKRDGGEQLWRRVRLQQVQATVVTRCYELEQAGLRQQAVLQACSNSGSKQLQRRDAMSWVAVSNRDNEMLRDGLLQAAATMSWVAAMSSRDDELDCSNEQTWRRATSYRR